MILNSERESVKMPTEERNTVYEDRGTKDSLQDRRTRFTRELIRNVYLDMWEDGDKKISVASLCHRANISRGTFYLHYRDVLDLQDDLVDSLYKDAVASATKVLDGSLIGHEKEFLDSKKNDRRWMLLYYGDNPVDSLVKRVERYVLQNSMKEQLNDLPWPEEKKRVAAVYMTAGALAVDRDAANHPWEYFEETNAFYDEMIHAVFELIAHL